MTSLEHKRKARRKITVEDFTKWIDDHQVKKRHYEIENLGKKLIKCGLHKYFLRDPWEVVS